MDFQVICLDDTKPSIVDVPMNYMFYNTFSHWKFRIELLKSIPFVAFLFCYVFL